MFGGFIWIEKWRIYPFNESSFAFFQENGAYKAGLGSQRGAGGSASPRKAIAPPTAQAESDDEDEEDESDDEWNFFLFLEKTLPQTPFGRCFLFPCR